MNVLVRKERSDKGLRRRRHASAPLAGQRPAEAPEPMPAPPAPVPAQPRDDGAPGRRALHGPVQDNALYNCHCGYVFEAAVSTSVDCPHCGGGQAW